MAGPAPRQKLNPNPINWVFNLLGSAMKKLKIPKSVQSVVEHVVIVFLTTFGAQLAIRGFASMASGSGKVDWSVFAALLTSAAAAGGSAVLHYLRGYVPIDFPPAHVCRPTYRRLGKKPYRHDKRNLQLVNYLTTILPTAPSWKNWLTKVSTWPMFLNDQLGDCTCAAIGHMEECWSADAGAELTITDAEVETAYEAVSGYDPTTGANDNGAVIADVLSYWQKTGIAGHKIGAYAQVNQSNLTLVRQAIDVFGGVDIGIQLPMAAQNMGNHWTLASGQRLTGNYEPGSWGGHSVCVLAYNTTQFLCVSWGEVIRIDVSFWLAYVDECWTAISQDFFNGTKSASGFDMAQLQADLKAI